MRRWFLLTLLAFGACATQRAFADETRPANEQIDAGALRLLPAQGRVCQGGSWTGGGGWVAVGHGSGIFGQYYPNESLSGAPAFQRTDVRIDFPSNTLAPGGSIDPAYAAVVGTKFSVKWSGALVPKYTETYTFKINGAESLTLQIAPHDPRNSPGDTRGETFTTLVTSNRSTGWQSADYRMTAGRTYDVIVTMVQTAGPWTAQVHWLSTGESPFPEEAIEPATPVASNFCDDSNAFANGIRTAQYNAVIDTGVGPALDDHGWPTEDFGLARLATLTYGDCPYSFPNPAANNQYTGVWTISFKGTAEVYTNGGGNFLVAYNDGSGTKTTLNDRAYYSYFQKLPLSALKYDPETGTGWNSAENTTTCLFLLTAKGQNQWCNVGFKNTDRRGNTEHPARNGLTHVQVMMPTGVGSMHSYAPGTVFSAPFLALAAPYTALRNLGSSYDLDYVAAAKYTDWSHRSTPTFNFQASDKNQFSVNYPAWEYKIMLANQTGKDLYVNLPQTASGMDPAYDPNYKSSYLYQLANLLKHGGTVDGVTYPGLLPHLNVYLEYGNENWNYTLTGPYGAMGNVAADINAAKQGNTADWQKFLALGAWVNIQDPVNLSGVYNRAGFYTDGSTFAANGGVDGKGNSLSANHVTNGTNWGFVLTPTIGKPGGNNVVSAQGQTIAADEGAFSDLQVFALAVSGNQTSQVFTVTYTDNSTQTLTQSISDWTTPQKYAGESIQSESSYYCNSGGGKVNTKCHIYSYTFKLNGKTVKSITLPNNANVEIVSMALRGDKATLPGGVIMGNVQQWTVLRLKDASAIFRTVYGDAAMPGLLNPATVNPDPRIRPVYEWQYGGAWNGAGTSSDTVLGSLQDYFGLQINTVFWGGGGGWYSDNNTPGKTADEVFQNLTLAKALKPGADNSVSSDMDICNAYGLHGVGYEGGFDFGNGGNQATPAQQQASADPRITPYVTQTLTQYFQSGGSLPVTMLSNGGPYGYSMEWAITAGVWDTPPYAPASAKLQGYLNAEAALPPPPTHGVPVGKGLLLGPGNISFDPGYHTNTTFLVGKHGDYNLAVRFPADPNHSSQTYPIQVSIDGTPVAIIQIGKDGGDWNVPLALNAGQHGVTLRNTATGTGRGPFPGGVGHDTLLLTPRTANGPR